MKPVVISSSFILLYILASVLFNLVGNNSTWINNYGVLLGLGLLICFVLNILGMIKGLKTYGQDSKRKRLFTLINIGYVILFIGLLIIPNIIDVMKVMT